MKMTRLFVPFSVRLPALFAGFLAVATSTAQAEPPLDFGGSYELAGHRTDRLFSLEVRQSGSRVKIDFTAAMVDGSGAAPDAEGTGTIKDGVLSFKFKDSFDNEGLCKLQPNHGVYQLDMVVTKVVEPSPLHFYGTLLLKKTSDRTISP
jgi:hypothetical protein